MAQVLPFLICMGVGMGIGVGMGVFISHFSNQETGGILFREYRFGRENSLSSAANSVSSAKFLAVSSL